MSLKERVALASLMSGALCQALIFTALAPVLADIARALGDSSGLLVQLMMTMPDIGLVIGSLVAGILVARLGGRAVLLIGLLAFALTGTVGFYSADEPLLLASRLVLGFAGAAVGTSATTMIGSLFSGDARSRYLGYMMAVGAAGGVLSTLIAGQLAGFGGWHFPFLLYGLGFCFFASALWSLPIEERAQRQGPSAVAHWGGLVPLLPLYGAIALLFSVIYMSMVQLSFLLREAGIASAQMQSLVIAQVSLGSAAGAFVTGRLRTRFMPWTTSSLLALIGIGLVLNGMAAQIAVFVIGTLLLGVGAGAANAHLSALVVERAPEPLRGKAVGFYYVSSFAGSFINPFLIYPIRMLLGLAGTYSFVGAILIALGAAFLSQRKTRKC